MDTRKRISTNLNINKAIIASATQNEVELAFIHGLPRSRLHRYNVFGIDP
jgi:hypothetical protein